MYSSFEDVLILLSKCRDEKIPVTVLLNAGDAVSVMGGFVTEVSPIGTTVLYVDSIGRKQAESIINFAHATKLSFQDPREAPANIRESMMEVFDYVVQIDLESTTQCVIYVRHA